MPPHALAQTHGSARRASDQNGPRPAEVAAKHAKTTITRGNAKTNELMANPPTRLRSCGKRVVPVNQAVNKSVCGTMASPATNPPKYNTPPPPVHPHPSIL